MYPTTGGVISTTSTTRPELHPHGFVTDQPQQEQEKESASSRAYYRTEEPRLQWTPQLHALFVQALDQLGGPFEAKPKAILKLMNVKGVSMFQLKSHLQKYRQAIKRGKTQRIWKEAAKVDGVQVDTASVTKVSDTTGSSSSESSFHVNEVSGFEEDILKYGNLLMSDEAPVLEMSAMTLSDHRQDVEVAPTPTMEQNQVGVEPIHVTPNSKVEEDDELTYYLNFLDL